MTGAMKLLIPLGAAAFALLLAGCGERGGGGNVVDNEALAAGAAANAMLANMAAPADPNDPARLQAAIAQAMPAALPGAKDALYRNVRAGAGGAVCGEVATKPAGRAAPVFRPFVINPDGLAVVADTPKLAFDDPADFVADAWIRWCASPEELQKLAPQLHRAASDPSSIPMSNVDAGAAGAPPNVPADATPTASPPAKAAPAKPPPPANVESFFNSVQHKQD
jgi:hypothetical protein